MLIRRRKLNLYDLKLFKEFLTSKDERRELQAGAPNDNFRKNICSEDNLRSRIPAAKLQQFASKFVPGVRC